MSEAIIALASPRAVNAAVRRPENGVAQRWGSPLWPAEEPVKRLRRSKALDEGIPLNVLMAMSLGTVPR
jgi:hypothetical protein